MSQINKINSCETRKNILTPKNTGYAATAALAFTTIRAFSNSKSIKKNHKIWGYITALLTLIHVGVVEYLHHKYKKM